MPGAEKRQNFNTFCAENILGMISPKSSNKNVRTTVRIKNSAIGEPKLNTCIKKMLQSIIMATLTKLLVINMVAKSLSLSSSNFSIFSSEGCFPSSNSLKSAGESEKKAISDADAKPDASRRIPAATMAMMDDVSGVLTDMLLKMSASWPINVSESKRVTD